MEHENILDQESQETPEAELLIFLLDGSGSMTETNTHDGREKADHEVEIVIKTLERLSASSKRANFRFHVMYFARNVMPRKIGEKIYYTIDEVLDLINDDREKHRKPDDTIGNPAYIVGGGQTALADAIESIENVIIEFHNDEGIPEEHNATVFIFTDGHENVRSSSSQQCIDEVKLEIVKLSSCILPPAIATISLGNDADDELLIDIASEPQKRQLEHLDRAGVLNHIQKDPDGNYRCALKGHADDEITEELSEAIRNFVDVLSQTV